MKYFLPLALATLEAAEHTVQETIFEKVLALDATFIPAETAVLKIDPQEWNTFQIVSLVDHGAVVKKGDMVITCDPEDFEEKLAEEKRGVKARKIALARAERELADLEISTPFKLETQRLDVERAKESLAYFKKTGRPLEEEIARERLEASKRSLSYYEEELRQLEKMYGEDQVTEETEEIILKRQQAAVNSARFTLKKNQLSTKRTLEITIPQKALDLERKLAASTRAFKTSQLNLPRILEEKRLKVADLQRSDQIADDKLADLEADAAFLTLSAPYDGTIYYGEISDGAWSPGQTAKFLNEGANLPKNTPLLTLVPPSSPLALHGLVGQEERLALSVGDLAAVSVPGHSGPDFSAELTFLAPVPDTAGTYRTSFAIDLPADTPIVGAMKAKLEVTTYRNEKALTVPTAAITREGTTATVEVKLADGKNELREVTLGESSSGETEILSGLSIDQVILVP